MSQRQPNTQRRRYAALLPLVLAATGAAAGLARADAGEAVSATDAHALGAQVGPAALVFIDGDHVVFEVGGVPLEENTGDGHTSDDHAGEEHADGKAAAPATASGAAYHDGFSTYDDAMLLDHYEIRLVSSDGIEHVRPHIAQAVASATAASGQSLELLPGTIASQSPGRGQIDVVVSSSSPCSGMWLGCGGPTIDEGMIVSGQIWINPRVLQKSTAELDNTVRHEFGHTLGLAHYEYLHEDRVQTMHPTRYDAASYESGDIAGLRFTAGTPPEETPPPPVRSSDPVGLVESASAGPFGIIVRGWAVDPDTSDPIGVTVTVDGRAFDVRADGDAGDPDRRGHGFSLIRLARTGTYEICAVARNVGAGADTPLGCQQLTVSGSSVGLLGLQTV